MIQYQISKLQIIDNLP